MVWCSETPATVKNKELEAVLWTGCSHYLELSIQYYVLNLDRNYTGYKKLKTVWFIICHVMDISNKNIEFEYATYRDVI